MTGWRKIMERVPRSLFTPAVVWADLGPGPLGCPLDGALGQPQPGEPWQHLRGRLGEATQGPSERRRLLGPGGQVGGRQTEPGIVRAVPGATGAAVVIGPGDREFADQAHDALRLPPLELGRVLAVRAGPAGPVVPPFFRPSRAV